MNFGLLLSFRNSSKGELSYSELYRKHVDLAAEAEDLGYDTIWLTASPRRGRLFALTASITWLTEEVFWPTAQ